VNDGGGDGAGCFDIKEWANTTESVFILILSCLCFMSKINDDEDDDYGDQYVRPYCCFKLF